MAEDSDEPLREWFRLPGAPNGAAGKLPKGHPVHQEAGFKVRPAVPESAAPCGAVTRTGQLVDWWQDDGWWETFVDEIDVESKTAEVVVGEERHTVPFDTLRPSVEWRGGDRWRVLTVTLDDDDSGGSDDGGGEQPQEEAGGGGSRKRSKAKEAAGAAPSNGGGGGSQRKRAPAKVKEEERQEAGPSADVAGGAGAAGPSAAAAEMDVDPAATAPRELEAATTTTAAAALAAASAGSPDRDMERAGGSVDPHSGAAATPGTEPRRRGGPPGSKTQPKSAAAATGGEGSGADGAGPSSGTAKKGHSAGRRARQASGEEGEAAEEEALPAAALAPVTLATFTALHPVGEASSLLEDGDLLRRESWHLLFKRFMELRAMFDPSKVCARTPAAFLLGVVQFLLDSVPAATA